MQGPQLCPARMPDNDGVDHHRHRILQQFVLGADHRFRVPPLVRSPDRDLLDARIGGPGVRHTLNTADGPLARVRTDGRHDTDSPVPPVGPQDVRQVQ